jgi:MFS family permease
MLSLNILIYGLLAPVAGSLGDRWKPTRVMPIGITILALATAGCAFARELWQFYLLFGVLMPIGTAFGGWPVLAPALANWFTKRRGLAISLGQTGGGLSFAYGMFAEFCISRLGWQHAYLAMAGILLLVLLPLYRLFHYRPEAKGLTAYGAAKLAPAKAPAAEARASGNPEPGDWTLRGAMRTHELWLLVFSYFLYWGIGVYLVLAHQVKLVEDVGYSSTFAASVFALCGIFMVVGQLSAGMSDVIGRELTVTISSVLSIAAMVALVSVGDTCQPWLLYVYATCFGYGVGLYSPAVLSGAADIFHGGHFGAIAGLLLTGMGIGGAVGPWLGGHIYDVSGSYSNAFVPCMVCFGLAGLAVWIAAPRHAVALRGKN